MSKKLEENEKSLIGSWVMKGSSVEQDDVSKRIQWLIDTYLDQVAVDGNNWSALYQDPEGESYWELTYPESHLHGGGPPSLHRISSDEANLRYGK